MAGCPGQAGLEQNPNDRRGGAAERPGKPAPPPALNARERGLAEGIFAALRVEAADRVIAALAEHLDGASELPHATRSALRRDAQSVILPMLEHAGAPLATDLAEIAHHAAPTLVVARLVGHVVAALDGLIAKRHDLQRSLAADLISAIRERATAAILLLPVSRREGEFGRTVAPGDSRRRAIADRAAA